MDLQVRLSALVLCAVPLFTLGLTFLLHPDPYFYTLYLPISLFATLSGGSIVLNIWKNSTSARNSHLSRHTVLVSAGLSFLVIAAGVYFSAVPAGLTDITLTTRMIVPLILGVDQTSNLTSMTQLLSDHYATYRNIGLLMMLVILPLLTALLGGFVLLLLRFTNRRGPAPQHGVA